jgi:chromate transport protein ChrA
MVHVVLHGVASTAVGLVFTAIYTLALQPNNTTLLSNAWVIGLAGLTFVSVLNGVPAPWLVFICAAIMLSRWGVQQSH